MGSKLPSNAWFPRHIQLSYTRQTASRIGSTVFARLTVVSNGHTETGRQNGRTGLLFGRLK